MTDTADQKNVERIVDVWKTSVEVQQHFNDLCLRVRSLAMTAVAAFLAGIGFSVKEKLTVLSDAVAVSGCLAVAAALLLLCFYFMDRFWYHKFLVGAVKYAQSIEEKNPEIFAFGDEQYEKGLGHSITEESPIRFSFLRKDREIHSSEKFHIFYLSFVGVFVVLAVLLFVSHRPSKLEALSEGVVGAAQTTEESAPTVPAAETAANSGTLTKNAMSMNTDPEASASPDAGESGEIYRCSQLSCEDQNIVNPSPDDKPSPKQGDMDRSTVPKI